MRLIISLTCLLTLVSVENLDKKNRWYLVNADLDDRFRNQRQSDRRHYKCQDTFNDYISENLCTKKLSAESKLKTSKLISATNSCLKGLLYIR